VGGRLGLEHQLHHSRAHIPFSNESHFLRMISRLSDMALS
jgi:hypothetical protein